MGIERERFSVERDGAIGAALLQSTIPRLFRIPKSFGFNWWARRK